MAALVVALELYRHATRKLLELGIPSCRVPSARRGVGLGAGALR